MLVESKYFLKNYPHKLRSLIRIDQVEILIEPNLESIKKLPQLKSGFESARESVELKLIGCGTEDEALKIALDVKNLLSLAFAHQIIFDRQLYIYADKTVPREKPMSDSSEFGYQIIHEIDLEQYLMNCYNNWANLELKEKNALFVSINYLNQTYNGFIEDRILKTVQAWESISNYWNINSSLSKELQDLRIRIKKVYRDWREENSAIDPNGHIGKSLTRSIDQEKLVSKLSNLARLHRLNIEKLNIDFHKLVHLRDLVAHTGIIDEKGSDVIELMEGAIKGLQIIFLDKLGYKGQIISNTVGYSKTIEIGEYLGM